MTVSAPIQYRVELARPAAHCFKIHCRIQNPDPDGQRVWLPAWTPGSYMIRDFARHIISMHAESAQATVALQKLDKQTWQCAPCHGPLTLTYEVYAWDLSVRTAHFDHTHAYFNGACLFVAVEGQRHLPCALELVRPTSLPLSTWRVATSLNRQTAALYEFGGYIAENYDALIDHPFEIGNFELLEFSVAGTPHAIAITGNHHADTARLCTDVKTICETQVRLFGELPAMERYVFLLTLVDNSYGGLEHRSSTSLIAARKNLPTKTQTRPSDDYITLLGLFSHEYFHTWNVKHITPAEFKPHPLQHEAYTHQLWAFEGITSYYDDLMLLRSGLIGAEKYLELLAKTITRVWREPGRFRQTLPESSFDAWTKYYKQDENSPNAIVSYYLKGSLFALCLDLYLRKETQAQYTLDDVMRELWIQHGKTGHGVTDETILNIVSKWCGPAAQIFFATYLESTQDLPIAELLDSIGVDFMLRAALSDDDLGGKPAESVHNLPFTLGGRVSADSCGVRVTHVYDNGPLQHANIAAGDILIAADGIKLSKENLYKQLAAYSIGDRITLQGFRRDELHTWTFTLCAAPADTCYLNRRPDAASAWSAWLTTLQQV